MFMIASFKMSKIKTGIELNVWHWGIPWNQISLMDSCAVSQSDGFQECAQEQKMGLALPQAKTLAIL